MFVFIQGSVQNKLDRSFEVNPRTPSITPYPKRMSKVTLKICRCPLIAGYPCLKYHKFMV